MMAAWAECAMPEPAFAVGDGVLPEDPTVLLFWGAGFSAPFDVQARDAAGTARPVVVKKVEQDGVVKAWSVAIDTDGPGKLTLTANGEHFPETSVEVKVTDTSWTPAPVTIVRQGATAHQWTCSHQATRDLDVKAPGAVGFRVRSARTAEALATDGAEVLLPTQPSVLWGRPSKGAQRLELGHVDCLGDTVSFDGKPLVVQLAAVYPDGSNGPWGAPIELALPPDPRPE